MKREILQQEEEDTNLPPNSPLASDPGFHPEKLFFDGQKTNCVQNFQQDNFSRANPIKETMSLKSREACFSPAQNLENNTVIAQSNAGESLKEGGEKSERGKIRDDKEYNNLQVVTKFERSQHYQKQITAQKPRYYKVGEAEQHNKWSATHSSQRSNGDGFNGRQYKRNPQEEKNVSGSGSNSHIRVNSASSVEWNQRRPSANNHSPQSPSRDQENFIRQQKQKEEYQRLSNDRSEGSKQKNDRYSGDHRSQGDLDERGGVKQERGARFGDKRCKVFVSNLDFKMTWGNLKDIMKQVGHVIRADIFLNNMGKSRGMGVVEFETQDEAQRAINQLNQVEVNGRKIYVKSDENNFDPNHNKQKIQKPYKIDGEIRRSRSPELRQHHRDYNREQFDRPNYYGDRPDNYYNKGNQEYSRNFQTQRGGKFGPPGTYRNYEEGNYPFDERDYNNQKGVDYRGNQYRTRLGGQQSYTREENYNYQDRQDYRSRNFDQKNRWNDEKGNPEFKNWDNEIGFQKAKNVPENRRGYDKIRDYRKSGERQEFRPRKTDEKRSRSRDRVSPELKVQIRGEEGSTKKYPVSFREGRQIFISNMPFSVTQKQLTELFSEYGQILEVLILKDERSGMPKGQGKILFEQKESAVNAAMHMNLAKFNNNEVSVKIDKIIRQGLRDGSFDRQRNYYLEQDGFTGNKPFKFYKRSSSSNKYRA